MIRTRLRAFAGWALAALVFGLAYTQAPLFTGNQHTKFLIGLARAGYGHLRGDWLAGTTDPLPIFTGLVQVTATVSPLQVFYAAWVALVGVYVYALLGIADSLYHLRRDRRTLVAVFAALVLVHSRLLTHLSVVAFSEDLPRLFIRGVAGQYILGPYFQPSLFGVFLLLSVHLFLKGRSVYAGISAAVAAVLLPAYALSAVCLALAYALVAVREKRRAAVAWAPLGIVVLLVAPVLIQGAWALRPHSAELWARGMEIIVRERIPHHAQVRAWLDGGAWARIALVVVAMYSVRRTRLLPVLAVPFAVGVALTLLHVALHSNALALVAPWRVSAFLVPLAGTVLIARAAAFLVPRFTRGRAWRAPAANICVATTIGLCLLAGVHFEIGQFRDRRTLSAAPMLDFVRDRNAEWEVYVVPPDVSLFDDFRLWTGAPVFVTWKSHPYRMDDEFLEWHARVGMARDLYASPPDSVCARAERVAAHAGATHVVVRLHSADPVCAQWTETFRDSLFAVYRIR